MAAMACAYAYEGTRPPLMPATPARSSQIPEPFDVDDGRGVKPALPLPPPTPPLRPSKVPSSLLPHHLGLCTEGLGSESSGDVDLGDVVNDVDKDASVNDVQAGQALPCNRQHRDSDEEPTRTRSWRAFSPPISVIGASGKPWLYLRPHRADGRLVLREMRIPSRELLQARREDGRFKLHFAQPQPEEE
ncbi:protein FANTASTIC FOUR 3-like [Phragmites australis]|uniref:protein FANTASTIC FOUR 3-like n=1 Tax=Phragmites australis TaxID=29695 RepID=UPI002D7890F5|nr:protein FANTASTIC FOUR 3-like [Phragmites australis]